MLTGRSQKRHGKRPFGKKPATARTVNNLPNSHQKGPANTTTDTKGVKTAEKQTAFYIQKHRKNANWKMSTLRNWLPLVLKGPNSLEKQQYRQFSIKPSRSLQMGAHQQLQN
jgi:hypothetical protein